MNDISYKSFMTGFITAWNKIVQAPHHVAAFVAVWYYIELLYMMSIAIFFYPPILISLIGVIVGVVLSIHILKLYGGNPVNATVQLFIMDIHVAYSIGLTIAAIVSDATLYSVLIIIMRDIIATFEMILVYTLTKSE
ncbi:MAG: hypothetical protein ACUVRK_07180 [Spirochaetota bacterium]